MRRYDMYFLQKKVAGTWETTEKASSASVLVSSLVRDFEAHEDIAVRVIAADWDETAADWVFDQVFYVDHGAIDLNLAEAVDKTPDDPLWNPDEDGEPEPIPGGQDFADAIHAASQEPGQETRSPPDRGPFDNDDEDEEVDDTFRRLGFNRAGQQQPVGPPPAFRPESHRSGRLFFIIGTVLIALILTGAASIALMVAFDSPYINPLIERAREVIGDLSQETSTPPPAESLAVAPATSGQVVRYIGVAPRLRGRWSSELCSTSYIEFDNDGYVIVTASSPPSIEIPISETLEDDYTWFLRRSPNLVEHFQKLSSNDIQKIGDTTRNGFLQDTNKIMARCP